MRYVVAIDWKAGRKSGFDFLPLVKADTLMEAMLEAPAEVGKTYGYKDVYCLRLILQTEIQRQVLEGSDCGFRYIPETHSWEYDMKNVEAFHAQKWYNVDVKEEDAK